MTGAAIPFAIATIAAATLCMADDAVANDRDIRAIMIPPTSCQVLVNDPFIVNPIQRTLAERRLPGTLEISCPLPVNNIDVSGRTNDNDLSKFKVFYRDSDGRGAAGYVSVSLFEHGIADNGSTFANLICTWNSNTEGGTSVAFQKSIKVCPKDLAREVFYSFSVGLSNFGAEQSFHGISFPD